MAKELKVNQASHAIPFNDIMSTKWKLPKADEKGKRKD
jgi:hypothetical protein